jgi:hypothetical protein
MLAPNRWVAAALFLQPHDLALLNMLVNFQILGKKTSLSQDMQLLLIA